MDKKYWNKYYKDDSVTEKHSDFAQFCIKRYKNELGSIFEVGCGGGHSFIHSISWVIKLPELILPVV